MTKAKEGKKNRSLSQVSVKDANKEQETGDFRCGAWLKCIGSKVMLSIIGTFIYRDEGVDKWPMMQALQARGTVNVVQVYPQGEPHFSALG
jgi:hypothetical protein